MELDKNTLKNLYVDKGLSCQKIATMHNCSRSKIESLVKKYELAKYKKSTRKIEVDIEQFKDLYINQGLMLDDIAERFGTTRSWVCRFIKKNNIIREKYVIPDKDKLYKYYIVENNTLEECAKYFNLNQITIKKYIKEYGIKKDKNLINSTRKNTNIKKYGVEYVLQSEEIKKKIIKTTYKKYGVKHPMHSNEVKDRLKNSVVEKYGVDNISKFNSNKSKMRNKFMSDPTKHLYAEEFTHNAKKFIESKFDFIPTYSDISDITGLSISTVGKYIILHDLKDNIKDGTFKNTDDVQYLNILDFKENPKEFITRYKRLNNSSLTMRDLKNILGVSYTCINDYLDEDDKNLLNLERSIMEKEVFDMIKDIDPSIKIIQNTREIIKPYELDLYLPEYNIAIECNPTSTHNSNYGYMFKEELAKPKDYHKVKSNLCNDHNIFLFHIFSYEWNEKKDIIKSMIRNLLNKNSNIIYARKTEVREVSPSISRKFLDENHLQGAVGSKIKLGLFIKETDILVSLMTFSRPRNTIGANDMLDRENTWELMRFCSLKDTNVIGGASKLFKYFIRNYSPSRIKSFSDISHSMGGLYKTLGFTFKYETKPSYYWVHSKSEIYYNRVTTQKSKLSKLLKIYDLDMNKTEVQIMTENGFVQVFNSGNKVFIWEK